MIGTIISLLHLFTAVEVLGLCCLMAQAKKLASEKNIFITETAF